MVRPGQRMGGGGGGGAPAFKEADAQAVASQIGGILAVAPEARAAATVVANGSNWSTNVTGSDNSWFDTSNWTLASGRRFADEELQAGAAVCVIGETVRRELFGARPAVGEQLRVKQFSCTVVGVLASKARPPWATTRRRGAGAAAHAAAARHRQPSRPHALVSMKEGADSKRESQLATAARAPQARRRRHRQLQRARHQAAGRHASGTTQVLTTLLARWLR